MTFGIDPPPPWGTKENNVKNKNDVQCLLYNSCSPNKGGAKQIYDKKWRMRHTNTLSFSFSLNGCKYNDDVRQHDHP